MNFQLDLIKDKVEFFEAASLQELEKKINGLEITAALRMPKARFWTRRLGINIKSRLHGSMKKAGSRQK